MNEVQNTKHPFDLEERTFRFAESSKKYVKKLPRTLSNIEYGRQLIRSSGSVAANYIEANEALSKKDFFMRIKICRKEAKESILWFRLSEPLAAYVTDKDVLRQEATELMKIFGSIISRN